MKRNIGIILILVGIGVMLLSILFSKGSHPNLDFLGNLSRMEVVLNEGEPISKWTPPSSSADYEGRVAFPLKYPLAVAVIVLLYGVGFVLLSKGEAKKEIND